MLLTRYNVKYGLFIKDFSAEYFTSLVYSPLMIFNFIEMTQVGRRVVQSV